MRRDLRSNRLVLDDKGLEIVTARRLALAVLDLPIGET
jgi:hypothetical protein